MPPPRRSNAGPGPHSDPDLIERLIRNEALLEGIAERQSEQHAENLARQEKAAQETREHRHRTANALQDMSGRISQNSSNIAKLSDSHVLAETRREALDTRLRTIETLVSVGKGSWKVLGMLATIIAAMVTLSFKVIDWLGWRH